MYRLLQRLCVAMAVCLAVGGGTPALGQAYPFFVQPLSVDDLDNLANAVELSPTQRLALLEEHAVYLDDLEALQNGRMKRFIDTGIAMVSEIEPFAGKFEIPPRREIEQVIREGRSIFAEFAQLDESFFDRVAPILSEDQALRLELARSVRAVERYRLVYLMAAGGMNNPAGIHLIAALLVNEVRLTPDMVYVLIDHQERLLNLTLGFERAVLAAVGMALDKIDEMGLRDMEQQDMMLLFMDEGMISDLGLFFDEASEPVQVAASKIGDENVRAWRELQPLVEDEAVRTDLDRRVVRQGWRRLYRGYGDADRRFDDVLERLPEGDPLRADAMIGQERLRTSFGSLLKEYIPLAAKRDRYRTASMFDGSTPMEGAEQIDNVLKRRDQALEQAEAMLVVLEADLPTDQEEDATAQNSGAGGGGGEPQVFAEATSEDPVLPFPPLELDRVDTMMQWVGAGDEARELVGMLHLDYQDGCDTLATTYQAAMDVIEENEELGDWRAKRRARRDLRAQTSESLRLLEETLFSDIELSLADDAARDRLQQVRIAFEHARRRQAMARDDWSLRRQSEAMLDLSVLVLDQSAAELPLQQRSAVIEALVRSDRSAEGVLDELGTQIEAVQLLESRMYGREASELDPEVQERVRSNWQQRRAKVGELASSLATINRSGSDRIADAMGPVTGEAFREAYRKAAFPDLFEGEDEVNEAFQRAAAIATLTDQQRRQLQDLQIRHVTLFGQLTDELIRLRSDNDIQISSWPPNSDSMNLAMRNEQLRYRRGQVAARSMAELAVLLGPDQWELVSDLQEQSESRGRQRGQFR